MTTDYSRGLKVTRDNPYKETITDTNNLGVYNLVLSIGSITHFIILILKRGLIHTAVEKKYKHNLSILYKYLSINCLYIYKCIYNTHLSMCIRKTT